MNVLVVDIGGASVKLLATGEAEPRQFPSGPALTAQAMVAGVKAAAEGWKYDVVAIGYPGQVVRDRPVAEPHNLAAWAGFDYKAAFVCPVAEVVAKMVAALEPTDVVIGGGRVRPLKSLPPGCREGDNANAFIGGFRYGKHRAQRDPPHRPSAGQKRNQHDRGLRA